MPAAGILIITVLAWIHVGQNQPLAWEPHKYMSCTHEGRKDRLLHILLPVLIGLVLLSGCCPVPKEQERWNDRLFRASLAVEAARDAGQPVPTIALVGFVGYPDRTMTCREFSKALPTYDDSTTRLMSDLRYEYLRAVHDERFRMFRLYEAQWEHSEEFLNLDFWLYDETLHFRSPVGTCWGLCAYTGFRCYIFYVTGDVVIGSLSANSWQGFQDVRAPTEKTAAHQ
jgi:hypothetical protein